MSRLAGDYGLGRLSRFNGFSNGRKPRERKTDE